MVALSEQARQELAVLLNEAERRGMIRPDFGGWMARARSEFDWSARHFRVMQDALNRVTAGEWKRVIFQIPIRHGKSEHNTISYNAYRLERDPTTRLVIASHKQGQAHKFSRVVRRLTKKRGVPMSADRNTAGEWETEAGGGLIALGANAGTASLNADVITVDDPIGGRAQAESQAERDTLWDWFTNDILSRTQPHTAVILTMSRWHQDDLVGRLLSEQAGDWQVVDLPGLAEPDDPLGREEGEALWPEMYDEAWMEQTRRQLGSYGFASLIQGRPTPREGGMFKWEWWQEIEEVPATGPMVRYWDTAGTEATGDNDPDYTAGALLCRMVDGRTAIVDVERFRAGLALRDEKMVQCAVRDRQRYGGRVRWYIETESGIGGAERTAQLIRRLQQTGIPVYADPRPSKNKVLRAEPLASKAEAGNVVLCPGEWRGPFRGEAAEFPGGRHDDQIDAAAGADAKLAVTNTLTVGTHRA